jgi:AcrR family transcriptional regulator
MVIRLQEVSLAPEISEAAGRVRRRGPAPSLERQEILEAVLALLDRSGVEGFNMRSLAGQLGVSAMTVYNYVPSKAQLIEFAVDSVIDTISPPNPAADDWEKELRRYAIEAWRVQLPHPWLPALLAERRVESRPTQIASRRALVDLFRAAGGDNEAVRGAVAAFYAFMIGSVVQVPAGASAPAVARATALFESALDILVQGLRARFGRRRP